MNATRTSSTVFLCAIAALAEGFDTQALGVAAPKLIAEFGLTAAESGWLFSVGTLGQACGAVIGGRVADRVGRKWALIVALLLFGMCSLATVASSSVLWLFAARILTGLGLGAALPNFITLAAEAVPLDRRLRTVTFMMAALPVGGALAGMTALGDGFGWGWHAIFYVGGVVPLVLAFVMMKSLRESTHLTDAMPVLSRAQAQANRPSGFKILFGPNRALTTLLLWWSVFFIQFILLLTLNWLPTLMMRAGFSGGQASWLSIGFNLSGMLGCFSIGHLQSGPHRRLWVATTYLGIAAALAAVGIAQHSFWVALAACMTAGMFIIGGQQVLLGSAPLYYPSVGRGTGVGGTIAVGRLGSFVGPLFAGALLAGGGSTATVLLGIEPFVLMSGAAALALCWRTQPGE